MSYFTRIEVEFYGDIDNETFASELLDYARQIISANADDWADDAGWSTSGGYFEEEIELLQSVFNGNPSSMHGSQSKYDALFEKLSQFNPEVVIGVRGNGEELEDIWYFYAQNGTLHEEYPHPAEIDGRPVVNWHSAAVENSQPCILAAEHIESAQYRIGGIHLATVVYYSLAYLLRKGSSKPLLLRMATPYEKQEAGHLFKTEFSLGFVQFGLSREERPFGIYKTKNEYYCLLEDAKGLLEKIA